MTFINLLLMVQEIKLLVILFISLKFSVEDTIVHYSVWARNDCEVMSDI